MARIRSIKPEIRRSLVVSSWPYPVRWTFVGLPGYLDDEGRGHDDTRLIKSELYPLDDDMTSRKLEHHLQQIAANGPLCRYEVDGRRYLHVTTWNEHQRVNRPSPSRIPPCPIHERALNDHGVLSEPSSPRARACAPAEQGAGKGAGSREPGREQGAGAAVAASTHHDDTAQRLLDEHLTAVGRPIPPPAATKLHEHIRQLTDDGTDEDLIRQALTEYRTRAGAKPGLLPHLVADLTGTDETDDPIAAALADPELLRVANGGRP